MNLKAVPDGILGSLLCGVDDVAYLQVESPVLHHLALVCGQVYLREYKDSTQCGGSMTFWCGSGSGSADPCL